MCRLRFILFWFTLAATLSVAPSARAHLVNTGFGPFDDGLTHLFVTPEDLLPVIALALFAVDTLRFSMSALTCDIGRR
jgi:hypothetical protein